MIYGFISSLDDETTKVFFRSKKIRVNNIYNAGSLGALTSVLQSGDVVYTVSCNRFASVRQVYTFARFCHERGIVLHFVAEPYLDIGNGKQWRPAVAKVIASMVESEQKAKGMMAQGFKMSDSQWEYAYRCFEMMNLDILTLFRETYHSVTSRFFSNNTCWKLIFAIHFISPTRLNKILFFYCIIMHYPV